MSILKLFVVKESFEPDGPHAMLDVALDAAEAGDNRWVDELSNISDMMTSNNFRSQVIDRPHPINAKSQWRADAHNQLDKAIDWKKTHASANEWESYLTNVQDILRNRATRQND